MRYCSSQSWWWGDTKSVFLTTKTLFIDEYHTAHDGLRRNTYGVLIRQSNLGVQIHLTCQSSDRGVSSQCSHIVVSDNTFEVVRGSQVLPSDKSCSSSKEMARNRERVGRKSPRRHADHLRMKISAEVCSEYLFLPPMYTSHLHVNFGQGRSNTSVYFGWA